MSRLFEVAFARLDRAERSFAEFGAEWDAYANAHPWRTYVCEIDDRIYEIRAEATQAAPPALSLAFSDWLSSLRAALDNGLYAWAAQLSGQDPPPGGDKLQFPIATTPAEFARQARRLSTLPQQIIEMLEKAQPYQSPFGPDTNLLYWLHELARLDRHRTLHIALGRVAEHRVRIGIPAGVRAEVDTSVDPYAAIDGALVIARFTASRRLPIDDILHNPGIGIDPEIREWSGFRIGGRPTTLHRRMRMTAMYMRNHVENMAHHCGVTPAGGFRTFDPDEDE